MSYPLLYESTETNFDHNGFGFLTDCATCVVTEERNGIFEIDFKYPVGGIHFEDIKLRRIVKARPNQTARPQLFRIYSITRPLDGYVKVYGEHISYDLSGVAVQPYSADNVQVAMVGIADNSINECPFTFSSDKSTVANFKLEHPASARACLGGVSGSILDIYGGEYEFDNYSVRLYGSRGSDRGVVIRYGKNLTDLQQDEKISNMYTAVFPFWHNPESGELVVLDEKLVPVPGTFDFSRVLVKEFTADFAEIPTKDQLKAHTESYIKNNELSSPVVSLAVSFAQLEQSEEYKGLAVLERVSLCDTVTVEFPALGVSSKAKAVRLLYDVLADRVMSVTLGKTFSNISEKIVEQDKVINALPSKTDIVQSVESVTNSITGANGGSVRMLDANGDGMPDTLYIADNPDPAFAQKVWRFNYEGWAASENGYTGPFSMGATLNDGIVADFITAGTLNADLIRTGTLRSKDGTFEMSINNNTFGMSIGSNLNIGNLSFFARTNGNVSVRWIGG